MGKNIDSIRRNCHNMNGVLTALQMVHQKIKETQKTDPDVIKIFNIALQRLSTLNTSTHENVKEMINKTETRLFKFNNKVNTKKTQVEVLRASKAHRDILRVEKSLLLEKLANTGSVLFRDYDTSIDLFSTLTKQYSERTAIDPARSFFAENVQLVNSGKDEMGLHCENGTTPLVPNFVWFYCDKAAVKKSQTTICDGVNVWNSFSEETKNLLLNHRITYSRTVKPELWKKYFCHHFNTNNTDKAFDQKYIDHVFSKLLNTKIKVNGDNSIFMSHSSFSVHPTTFSNERAFANSLLGPSYNYEPPTIKFENGNKLPEWLTKEIKEKTSLSTTNIDWQSGDILLIDNWRVMHGRRRIEDLNRKIYISLGFMSKNIVPIVGKNNGE